MDKSCIVFVDTDDDDDNNDDGDDSEAGDDDKNWDRLSFTS
jgi:hypothetical protein